MRKKVLAILTAGMMFSCSTQNSLNSFSTKSEMIPKPVSSATVKDTPITEPPPMNDKTKSNVTIGTNKQNSPKRKKL